MAARTFIDEHNVMQIIYDTPEDLETTTYYQPGDPLYEKGIAGQMLINLPHNDSEGKPVMIQRCVELKRIISA